MGNMVMNYLMFDDVTVYVWVFGPSIISLQCFVNIRCDHTSKHETVFNCKKVVDAVFPIKK